MYGLSIPKIPPVVHGIAVVSCPISIDSLPMPGSYVPPPSYLSLVHTHTPSRTGTDHCGAQPGPAQMEGEDTTRMDTTSGVSLYVYVCRHCL